MSSAVGPQRTHRHLSRGVTLALVVVVIGVVAVMIIARTGAPQHRIERLEPVSYRMIAPDVLSVEARWLEDGYCSGQLTAIVREQASQVIVEAVESSVYTGTNSGCAGLGTVNGLACADHVLSAPLGTRTVVNGSDGRLLERRD